MKERPILFSGPMVRAILEGRKTQTRRVIRPMDCKQKIWLSQQMINEQKDLKVAFYEATGLFGVQLDHPAGGPLCFIKCPYGINGDRLWVREAFLSTMPIQVRYRADDDRPEWKGLWKPSIHMPRRFSRITLEITEVRVERLRDISRNDCLAEGAPLPDGAYTMQDSYRGIWENINGAGSWDQNPWVWVIEFKRIEAARQSEAA